MESTKGNILPAIDSVVFDALAFAAVLILFGCTFYLRWDLWDDQAAQAYMTWGMFHGMWPYIDLVDPNWPGILLPHTLAYLMSGVDAWGLRLLDLLFTYTMLVATSVVLARWKVGRAMRLLAGCCYLTNYFAIGWMWTAQRESFCWPLFVIGTGPFLLTLGPRDGTSGGASKLLRGRTWMWFGLVCGLSLWVKPTVILPLAVLWVMTALMCDRDNRGRVIRAMCWHLLGMAAITVAFIIALAAAGALGGFIKWGVEYDLGPYSQVKFAWPVRLHMMFVYFTLLKLRPIGLALAILGSVVTLCWIGRNRRSPSFNRPMIASLGLMFAGLFSVFLQGKPGSLYHFIPFNWALAVFVAIVWSIIPWRQWMSAAAMALGAMIVLLTVFKEPRFAGMTAGSVAGKQLNSLLAADDQLVEWGYSPTLLLRAQRRTPFMTFIGTAFLTTSPADSWAAHEVLNRLNVALQNPSVRYLLVETLPNYKIQKDTPNLPMDYLDRDAAISQTLRTQYKLLPDSTIGGFRTFIHDGAAASSRF